MPTCVSVCPPSPDHPYKRSGASARNVGDTIGGSGYVRGERREVGGERKEMRGGRREVRGERWEVRGER